MNRTTIAALALLFAACGAENDSAEKGTEEHALEDYEAAQKADSWRQPTVHGTLTPELASNTAFDDDALFHSWDFALTGDATVTLAIASSDRNLDTVMYLYSREPGATRWGRYLTKNDDAHGTVQSAIEKGVGAGEYRVMVKGFKRALRGAFSLTLKCAGDGCPTTDGGEVELPSAGSYTKGCADQLTHVLDSQLMGGDAWSVMGDDEVRLPANARTAVGLYRSMMGDWASAEEIAETELEVELRGTEDGQLIDVTDGGDESNVTYVFSNDGLVMSYFHNQSPWVDWYCAEEGEAAAHDEEPGEWCAGSMLNHIPHDQDSDADANGVVDDEAPAAAQLAAQYYRKVRGLDADAQVAYEGRSWADGWTVGAELTVKSEGQEAATYLIGGDDYDMFVYFERTQDGDVAICAKADDL